MDNDFQRELARQKMVQAGYDDVQFGRQLSPEELQRMAAEQRVHQDAMNEWQDKRNRAEAALTVRKAAYQLAADALRGAPARDVASCLMDVARAIEEDLLVVTQKWLDVGNAPPYPDHQAAPYRNTGMQAGGGSAVGRAIGQNYRGS